MENILWRTLFKLEYISENLFKIISEYNDLIKKEKLIFNKLIFELKKQINMKTEEEFADAVPICRYGTRNIWDASLQGILPAVKYFYSKNSSKIHIKNKKYYDYTSLNLASREGHLDVVEFLLSKGVDVDSMSCGNTTPLMKAAANGHLNVVNLLLDNGADINLQNLNKITSLHKAVCGNHLEVVKLLIERGANKMITDSANETPLDYAKSSRNQTSIVHYLSSKVSKQINTKSEEEFADACDVPIGRYGTRNIWDASLQGILPAVKYFYSKNSSKIHIKIKKYYDYTSLNLASREGHLDVVKFLLSKGVDVDSMSCGNTTPLMKAAANGHLKVVNLLLDNGADINLQNLNKITSLHKAVCGNHLEVVKLLIVRGANKMITDSANETPLDYAKSSRNQTSIVHYFSSL